MGAASGPNPPEDGEDVSWKLYVLDVVSSAASVALVGFLIFSVSGVWPPLVAITSGSMQPHMERGDLVFVMETDRFPGEGHHEATGVVTAATGAEREYTSFHGPGDVIIFQPNGQPDATPVIHRAMLWVEAGENWYDEGNPEYMGSADDCSGLSACPAPYDGFITKGDNEASNGRYDQLMGISEPVKPEWIVGKAEARIPYMGEIRLGLGSVAEDSPLVSTASATDDDGNFSANVPNETKASPAAAGS